MEYAEKGDLSSLIENHKKSKVPIKESTVWSYLIQMARGLKALHEMQICHRDLKCANVFVTKDNVLKLGDMNVSKVTFNLLKSN